MVERHDGKRHKFIAIEDPSLCVSCGICVGSCDGVAVTLGETAPALLWDTVAAHLTLARLRAPGRGLDRSLYLRASCLARREAIPGVYCLAACGTAVEVIPLPCVGTVPPDLLSRTLDQGAAAIRIVGCPPDDCANREGNLWLEQRITRERVPRLKRPYANAPITAAWLPPNDFADGLGPLPKPVPASGAELDYLEQRRMFKPLSWRNYVMAFLLLALVLVAQILLTDLPFSPYPDTEALNQVVIQDLGAPIGRSSYLSTTLGPALTVVMEVDGQLVHEQEIPLAAVLDAEKYPHYFQDQIAPGLRDLRLTLHDSQTGTTFVIFDQQVTVSDRDIITIPTP